MGAHALLLRCLLFPRGVCLPLWGRCAFCLGTSSKEESSMKVSGRKTGSALSHAPDNWNAVDWRWVERNVRGMQIRIAKATREGDWRRVKALQRMLTRTLSVK